MKLNAYISIYFVTFILLSFNIRHWCSWVLAALMQVCWEQDMGKEAALLLHSVLPLYNGQEGALPLLLAAVNMVTADHRQ